MQAQAAPITDVSPVKPSPLAGILSALLVVVGLLVIIGWVYRIPILKGAVYGTFVAPNTALLLLATGISIQLQERRRSYAIGVALASLVALFAATILIQYATGLDLKVDRLFLASRLPDWSVASAPGRIAAPTTVGFVLIGIGLLFLKRRQSLPLDLAAAGVWVIGYLAIVGYVYGLRPFYGYIMALPTALTMPIAASAMLAASPHSWLRASFYADDAGGIVLRRMAPLVMIVFPLLGWMRLHSLRMSWIPVEFGQAVFVLASVVIFFVSVLLISTKLSRVDAERKQVHAALIRSEKLAATGRLAATVAHEINNPLAAALNTIYLARTSDNSRDARDFLDIAERELKRVSVLTRQSLGFYRSQGKAEVVPVKPLGTEVIDLFAGMAAGKGVYLDFRCDDRVSVLADAGELRQVLSNLITNAIDATDRGGHVHMEARASRDEQVEIAVSDDGRGIPADVADRIFEPFFTTKEKVGTGLGLFVVWDLVNKNRGRIAVHSRTDGPGHGSKFVVTLPAAEPEREGRSVAV